MHFDIIKQGRWGAKPYLRFSRKLNRSRRSSLEKKLPWSWKLELFIYNAKTIPKRIRALKQHVINLSSKAFCLLPLDYFLEPFFWHLTLVNLQYLDISFRSEFTTLILKHMSLPRWELRRETKYSENEILNHYHIKPFLRLFQYSKIYICILSSFVHPSRLLQQPILQ